MLSLKLAERKDIPWLVEIEKLVFLDDFWSANVWESTLAHDFNITYVLYADMKKVGYFCVSQIYDELHILNIAVIKEERGKGYGKYMMRYIFDNFSKDISLITLEVRESNVIARTLYESFGFIVVGKRPKYYSGNETALIMDKTL